MRMQPSQTSRFQGQKHFPCFKFQMIKSPQVFCLGAYLVQILNPVLFELFDKFATSFLPPFSHTLLPGCSNRGLGISVDEAVIPALNWLSFRRGMSARIQQYWRSLGPHVGQRLSTDARPGTYFTGQPRSTLFPRCRHSLLEIFANPTAARLIPLVLAGILLQQPSRSLHKTSARASSLLCQML
jgi:hypothetical protein